MAWPCANSGVTPVLDDVTYEFGVKPRRTITTVRTATTGGPEHVSSSTSLRGAPEELPGSLTHTVRGLEVNRACGSGASGRHRFTELLATMVVDARGASITAAAVDYHVGDKRYRLKVPWTYVACGSAIKDTGLC